MYLTLHRIKQNDKKSKKVSYKIDSSSRIDKKQSRMLRNTPLSLRLPTRVPAEQSEEGEAVQP